MAESETAAPRLDWRKPWYGIPLALGLALGCALLRLWDPTAVEVLRLQQFDALHRLAPNKCDGLTVWIVDVDEESLAALGQWPWPRSRIAALIDKLSGAEVAAIGIDMVFDQPDRLSPPGYARQIDDLPEGVRLALAQLPSTDAVLASALARAPVSLATLGADFSVGGSTSRSPRSLVRLAGGEPEKLNRFVDAIHSLPELARAAAGEGIANALPERDNIVRRIPASVRVGNSVMPSLGFDTLRVALGVSHFSVISENGRVQGVSAGDLVVPTGSDGTLWLYHGPHRPERFLSAAAVLQGRVDLTLLKGQVVLLGSTAYGLGDFHASPLVSRMPGVEIQAQAIENMADGIYLSRPDWMDGGESALIVILGALVALLLPFRRTKLAGLILICGVIAVAGAAIGAFLAFRLLTDVTTPILASGLVFAQMIGAQLLATDQERRRIAVALAEQREVSARIEGELNAARQIQMGMLPKDFPDLGDVEIAARIEPAKAVGGDFYDIWKLPDGRIYFAIGDVSGKGVPAALFMALAKALSRASARSTDLIDAVVTETNRELSAENPAMMFVTVVIGIFDPVNGDVFFANAGHDAPLRIGMDASLQSLEGDGGPPLCVLDDFEYPAIRESLASGQALVLFTDGVTEALSADGELYGTQRLHAAIGPVAQGSADEIAQAIVDDVARFSRGAEPADDVTVLVIKRL